MENLRHNLDFASSLLARFSHEGDRKAPGGCRRHPQRKDGEIMKMLSPAEVAERLNVSYDTALRMIKTSGIAYLKIGRQYRVSEAVIDELTSQDDVVIVDFEDAG